MIIQAFEKCAVGNFNLSYASLTSWEARDELRNLKVTNRAFWDEITEYDRPDDVPASDATVQEDVEVEELAGVDVAEDDSDLPTDAVIALVVNGKAPTGVKLSPISGELASSAIAESSEAVDAPAISEPEELGRGRRRRVQRDLARYNGEHFW